MEEPTTQPSVGKIVSELRKRKKAEYRVWRSVIFSVLITLVVISIAKSILPDPEVAAQIGLFALITSLLGSLILS